MKRQLCLIAALFLTMACGTVALASFDGDANTDAFMPQDWGGAGQVVWYEYDPDTGGKTTQLILPYQAQAFNCAAIGNLDGDQYPDLLIGGQYAVYWFESYQDNVITLVDSFSGPSCQDIRFYGYADPQDQPLDPNIVNDGRYRQVAYLARGDELDAQTTVTSGVVQRMTAPANNQAQFDTVTSHDNRIYQSVMVVDFDQDSKLELFAASQLGDNPSSGDTHLYELAADGTAGYIRSYEAGKPGARGNVAGRLDPDAFYDIFITTQNNLLQWFEANGSDNGLSWRGTKSYREAKRLVIADIDQDGSNDLVYSTVKNGSGPSDCDTGWYESSSDNAMTHIARFMSYHYSHCLAVTDWDADGAVDVIFGCRNDGAGYVKPLMWTENTGDNTFTSQGYLDQWTYYGTDIALLSAPDECGQLGSRILDSDLNADCVVNIVDVMIMAQQWLNDSTQTFVFPD